MNPTLLKVLLAWAAVVALSFGAVGLLAAMYLVSLVRDGLAKRRRFSGAPRGAAA